MNKYGLVVHETILLYIHQKDTLWEKHFASWRVFVLSQCTPVSFYRYHSNEKEDD